MIQALGTNTGLKDSNGRPIKSGNTIRYEYTLGFNRSIIDEVETKIHCVPFSESEKAFHETVMKYEVKKDCAGYFLDLPTEMSFIYCFSDTLKYYVVDGLISKPKLEDDFSETLGSSPVLKAAVIIFHKNVQNYPKKWIDECIESIKIQTYQNFDVFEVDYGGSNQQIYPGSNFESREFDNHAEAHNYLLDKVFALNYDCAFNVNVDDIYAVDRFEKQIACMEEGCDVVSSNYYNINENGETIKEMAMSGLNPDIEASSGHNIIAHPVVCYSRNFWETCEKLDPKEIPVDDFKMWQRSYQKGTHKFLILPDYLLYYRVHENKVSHA